MMKKILLKNNSAISWCQI